MLTRGIRPVLSVHGRLQSIGAVFGLFAAMAVSGYGQTTVGQILGTVSDASGGAVPGAAVTVTNTGTNEHRRTASDSSGNYIFPQLPVGHYNLTVELHGFQKFVATEIDLRVDDRRRQDATLQVGEVTQAVEVKASAATVNSANATIGEVITEKPILDLPLNGRNFLQLAQLTPGTIPPVVQNGAGHDQFVQWKPHESVRGDFGDEGGFGRLSVRRHSGTRRISTAQ